MKKGVRHSISQKNYFKEKLLIINIMKKKRSYVKKQKISKILQILKFISHNLREH